MSTLVPAILPTSRNDLEQKLSMLVGLVDEVQIDVVDGRFIQPASWPYGSDPSFVDSIQEGDTLPHLGELRYEMDLMVRDPEKVVGMWIASGATRLTLHAESSNYLSKVIKELEVRYGHAKDFAPGLLSVGIALNIGTELAVIEPLLKHIDYVQFMGIRTIGLQAQPFDQDVLRKMATFKRKHPHVLVQVDGGVSLTTAPQLLSAGVDRLVVGSAIWKSPDIAATIAAFNSLIHEYSIYS